MSNKSLLSEHTRSFSTWLKDQVMRELQDPSHSISKRLKSLAGGPNFRASFYSGYVYNGCKFYTKEQDKISTMQNSGVVVEAEAMHFASAKDNRPAYGKMLYYGIIEQIIEMQYNDLIIPIFGCKWVNNNTVVEYEDIGFTLVNFDKLGHEEDPYILVSQAKQVFYMTDPANKKRSAVIKPRSRHIINEYDDDIELEESSSTQVVQLEDVINDHGDNNLLTCA
uniref:DUF4216 domain-containing protein n=1 Tax=Chenopodium quinoa TaxID=63459 RepID=A0A803MY05_CHEQI